MFFLLVFLPWLERVEARRPEAPIHYQMSHEEKMRQMQQETLLQQNETLLQQIAELKRENEMMANKLQKIDVELQCIMCSDVSEEDVVLRCGHHFCRPCLNQWHGTGRTNGKNV